MSKLLIICGPTATGKTDLGLYLAKKFDGEIISADSRQVYRDMDLGTGKDIPPNSKYEIRYTSSDYQVGFYQVHGVQLWGYDLVSPDQDFSVAQFKQAAGLIIADITNRSKLPIVVGGTGLYIKALTQPIDTISIKPNRKLRRQLEKLSLKHLQLRLKQLNLQKYQSMNHSDINNPRRLIRAIEIVSSTNEPEQNSGLIADQLWIGLKTSIDLIDQKIEHRVKQRFNTGMLDEVKQLMATNLNWTSNPATATGYKQIRDFIDHKTTKPQTIKLWSTAEKQYARRQLTWFNKLPQINWFDITSLDYKPRVDSLVKDWYS